MPETAVILEGSPVRTSLLPYGRQSIDEDDIQAVVDVLRGERVTCGPAVDAFEQAFATYVDATHAVAVSNGTAALHATMFALGIGPGDEVIVPPMTFAATANAVVFQGGTPVFADVDADTLLIDPASVESRITPRTRAIIAVDYTGQPCDYDALREISKKHQLALVADACHAAGATYRGQRVGSIADLNVFSFHPVKHLTTGEGGMVTTNDAALADRMRRFRNHCMDVNEKQRSQRGAFAYQITDLGYNYRITDIQCALGASQLHKLPRFVERRQAIAARYRDAFRTFTGIEALGVQPDVTHAYHLFVVRVAGDRNAFMQALRKRNIGTNVHYIPVHLHPLYRERFGTGEGLCPVAESAYEQIVSLPIFPAMTDEDVQDVIDAVTEVADVQ